MTLRLFSHTAAKIKFLSKTCQIINFKFRAKTTKKEAFEKNTKLATI